MAAALSAIDAALRFVDRESRGHELLLCMAWIKKAPWMAAADMQA